MSFSAIAHCIKIENIKPTTKLVLLVLANYANENFETYPSKRHIAKMCNCDERTILRSLQELQEKRIIKRKERFEDGRQTSNLYTLLIDNAKLSPTPTTKLSPHNTINNIHIVKVHKKANGRIDYPAEFEEFWKEYPSTEHKTKKDKTFAMWKKINDKKLILQCVKNYAIKKQGKFIHNPFNWFRDKVYENFKEIVKDKEKSKNFLAG